MTDWNGWAGAILNVDLTNMKLSREVLSREFALKYIGGSGFGSRILYDEVSPGDNALEPENVIIIGQGPLSGTAAPGSGRYDLVSKSPLTGIYGRSNGGGFFGPEMKWAGYDLIVIRGKSEKPVYLWIDDEHAELRDATHLWGKDTWVTERMIREELGDSEIQALKIGPAGENMCYSSCVIGNLTRAAGRCSMGAVWGSKKLKAVAVRGSGEVSIAKPREFMELCKYLRGRAKCDPMYSVHTTYGTSAWVSEPHLARELFDKFGRKTDPALHSLHHSHFAPLYDKNLACFGCALHCSHYYTVKSGKYEGTAGEGVEGYLQHVTGRFGVGDPAFLCKYNNLCNQLGLHIVAPALGLAWAMDLYQHDIITKEDCDGLELTRGNEDVILQFLHKIAYKEGFGEIVDAYPVRAAEKLGRGSDEYISHTKGVDAAFGGVAQCPLRNCLAYSVATRGQDHLTGAWFTTRVGHRSKQMTDDILERLGKERYNDPKIFFEVFSPDHNHALVVYNAETIGALCDMTGICKFASEGGPLYIEGIHTKDFAQLLSAATGIDFSVDDLVRATERMFLLSRAFNAREGIGRIDDYPYPFHYQLRHSKEHPRYDYSAFKFSIKDYDKVLDEYYKLRGCDQEGIPTREKLAALGLQDVAEDLASRGILPNNI